MSEKIESFVAKRHDKRIDFEDCQSCRLVNGGLIVGVGIFLGYSANKQTTKLNRYAISGMALGVCGLGVARMLGLPPFQPRENTQQKS